MFQTLHLMSRRSTTSWHWRRDSSPSASTAGLPAPGTYKATRSSPRIPETRRFPEGRDMIRLLVEGQEAVVRTARKSSRW